MMFKIKIMIKVMTNSKLLELDSDSEAECGVLLRMVTRVDLRALF